VDDATAAVLEAAVDTTSRGGGGGGGGESKEVEIERAGVVMVMLSGTKKILFVLSSRFCWLFFLCGKCIVVLASDCRRVRQRRKK
jgi:hypothetical protein